jgi:methionyl-tRNA formyltransferase
MRLSIPFGSRLSKPRFFLYRNIMRIIFMGTPTFAVPTLDAIAAAGHDIIAVYTQPPRRAGRGKALSPSPIHLRAEVLGIQVHTPATLRDPIEQDAFAALNADAVIVAAYGLILPQAILDAPRFGCINVHASLLPRWRGAAPIQRAILAGDTETGVTIMQMEAGLDTGPMLAKISAPIEGKTGGALTEELADIGAELLVKVLNDLNAFPPVSQPRIGMTYAPKIDKTESRLDFLISAPQAVRQVRAFAPAPGAFFEYQGERIRILDAKALMTAEAAPPGTVIDGSLTIACNPGAIQPLMVQRAGRAVMKPAEMLRGFAIPMGTRLA